MEILQLKYFFDSAKTENFSKTAEKYMVPTTSVSASIKRLESELGCALFDRYPNRISLNTQGKILMKSLYTVFNELNHAVEELSGIGNDTREIKILVRAMRDYVTDIIIEFSKNHPQIKFKTTLDFKEKNIDKYDIIIDEKNDAYKNLECFELCCVNLKLITHSYDPLCYTKVTLNDLSTRNFISWGDESNMHRILLNVCQKAGFIPNIAVMTNDMKCQEKLISSGIGIGLAMENGPQFRNKDVRAINVTDFNETYTVCSYHKKEEAYGNLKLFLDFIQDKVNSERFIMK